MRALRSPSKSGNPGRRVRRTAVLLSLVLLLISLPVAAEESNAAVWTVWKAKDFNFSYRSSLAVYSCDALQDRVASIFRAVGARDDLDVKVSGCDMFPAASETITDAWPNSSDRFLNRGLDRRQRAERGQFASVRVRAMIPTEVTPEVLVELEKDQSRRELVSRVTGNPAAAHNTAITFPAQWQSVTLSRRSIGLEPQECELLEQMSTGVLRELKVRIVRRHVCDRNRVSLIPPQLIVEALMGIAIGAGSLSQIPAGREDDADPGAPAPSAVEPSEPAAATPQE